MNIIQMEHGLIYELRGITTRILAVGEGVIRVTHTRRPDFLEQQSAVVVQHDSVPCRVTVDEQTCRLVSGVITVSVDQSNGRIVIQNADGQILLQEPKIQPHQLMDKPVYRYRYQEDAGVETTMSVDGVRASVEASERYLDRMAYECRQNFVFDANEALYGLGSHEEGIGNLRGHTRILYQQNMKAVVPMLVSTKGWGILFDMGSLMSFHDDVHGSYLWAAYADELDWYFLYGNGEYASLMERYRWLTGATPMLPKYALGYIQSKERYVDAEEILSVAKQYRDRGVPLDVMVLDWQSWPANQWGYKTFDTTRFPDPKAFIQELHDMNVHFMISIWPSMNGDENKDRDAMLAQHGMLGNQTIYNAFDPDARALYWQQARDGLFRHGVDAWWCDCSEPFEADWRGEIKPEPFERVRINLQEAEKYIDPAMTQLYSLYHSSGLYEGQRSVTEEKRVFNLTRSSYAGQHRYGTVTWSGDVSANWETLQRHIPEGLNFCATGEAYWTTDVGGFFPMGGRGPWFYAGEYAAGSQDLGYRELFVRWMQYAVALPLMRAHGTGTPREIWRFGEKGEPFYDAIEKAIQLRYRLLPYLYSLMAQTAFDGMPMLRVPALVFPQDVQLRGIDDEMMLGDAVLIKPVTKPMYYTADSTPVEQTDRTVQVYLPAGCDWYDFETNERYAGGQSICVEAPLDKIPMFVRAGAVLPIGSVKQYADAPAEAPLELRVYPGASGSVTLYDDAGDGYNYEKGECAFTSCTWQDDAQTLSLGAQQGAYPGMPAEQKFTVQVIGRDARVVLYNGQAMTISME